MARQDFSMNDEEYIEMRSLEDKYTKPLSTWEVAQAFPECRDIAGRVIYFLEKETEEYISLIVKYPIIKEFMKFDPRVIRLKELRKFMNLTRPNISGKSKLDIQKAKNVPIESIYDFKISQKNSSRIRCICPFHDERTGSFFIFKDKNKCHCFSCGFHGDSIDFIEKLKAINFVEAVKYLTGIRG